MDIAIDILVIDAGGTDYRAAVAIVNCGTSVPLASRKPLGESGATGYPVAEMAGYDVRSISIPMNVQMHYNDTIEVGQGMVDEKLAATVASRVPEATRRLEEWRAKLEHENGGRYVFRSCFSHYPRTRMIRDRGEPVIRVMKDQIHVWSNITVMDDTTIMGLYVKDSCHVGACGLTGREMVYIDSRAVILTSEGHGQASERSVSPSDVTDGGCSVVYHTEVNLVSMEFMQIGMGFPWFIVNIFNGYVQEIKPRPSDREGKDIFEEALPQSLTPDQVMHEYGKHSLFSNSDDSKYLEAAVQTAVKNGRDAQRGGIGANFSYIMDEYVNSLKGDCGTHHIRPTVGDYSRFQGVDLLLDQVEVAYYAHAINGGVRINTEDISSIQGSYVAGECAGGPHGVGRLEGNMMMTCQVFGEITDTSAAGYALRTQYVEHVEHLRSPCIEEMRTLLHRRLDYMGVLNRLRKATQGNLLMARTRDGLTRVLNAVGELEGETVHADTCQEIYPKSADLYHMFTTMRTVVWYALEGRRNRGSHHRADHPLRDRRFSKPVTIRRND